jgi:hypothetical protein
MRVRRRRLVPWTFPWIQTFPGASWPQHFRTGSSHPHGRIGSSQFITLDRLFTSGDCERRDSVRRKSAAEASQAQSVEHRKVNLRSRGRGRRADASAFPRRRTGAAREQAVERDGVTFYPSVRTNIMRPLAHAIFVATKPRRPSRSSIRAGTRGACPCGQFGCGSRSSMK